LTTTKWQWNPLGARTLVAHLCTADIMPSSKLGHFFGFANSVKILQYQLVFSVSIHVELLLQILLVSNSTAACVASINGAGGLSRHPPARSP
jgi:hypothetical protein